MTVDPHLLALTSARNIGALATIKSDGRPQLSTVNFTLDLATTRARISVIDGLATVHNLRRDRRASIFVGSPDGWTYLSLIHISEPTRLGMISYAVFCLKKKKKI